MSDAELLEAIEIRRRRRAREALIPFAEYVKPNYVAAYHHRLIAEKLEAIERDELDRLMIFMPPRHGKSELVSRLFPVWYLARHPFREVIVASYSTDLARTFGGAARSIATSPELAAIVDDDLEGNEEPLGIDQTQQIAFSDRFAALRAERFGFEISRDTAAKDEWKTTAGGGLIAAGVDRGITGRGGNLAIIDDPVKDRKAAESETVRETIKEWYRSALYTRLETPSAVVICMTRWHEDDLAGWQLELERMGEGDGWEVLSLPAIQDGRALWPEKYDERRLSRIKLAIGPREWQALYQQEPSALDGSFFRREDFRYFDKAPDNVRVFGTSDLATQEDGGDYTVHLVWALDVDDNLYLLDAYRKQADSADWCDALVGLVRMHAPMRWGQESGPIWRANETWVMRELRNAGEYVDMRDYPSTIDKATRALGFQARMRMRRVFFKRGAAYLDWLEPELLKFPTGKNDDGVDACGLAGRVAAELGPPGRKAPPPRSSRTARRRTKGKARWS